MRPKFLNYSLSSGLQNKHESTGCGENKIQNSSKNRVKQKNLKATIIIK